MTTFTARKVPSDLAGSGWYELLPAPDAPRELEGNQTADWVIVGAGFAGLSAARRLTQLCPGDRIVVVDAQRVGWGAAGRNSGFMIDLPHELQSDDYAGGREADLAQIRMNRAAIAFAGEMVSEFGLEEHWNPGGKIHGATDGKGLESLKAFQRHLDGLGEPYSDLNASDMKRITGTDYYAGGMHAPGCAQIQPAGYIRGLADGLKPAIEIYENSAVLKIETGATHKVHTGHGSISSPKVIMTVNGHAESFGLYDRRLMHIFTFASMTRRLTTAEQSALGGDPEWGLIPAHPMGSTVRRLKQGRITVRSVFTYNPNLETTAAQVEKLGRVQDRAFAARFPMLPDVAMDHRWGGHLCLSLNSVPAFGEIEPGFYTACCQNGLGVGKGTLSGMLIADLAAGSGEPMVEEMLSLDMPKKLYPEPFMTMGARTHLWWTHRQAGRDL